MSKKIQCHAFRRNTLLEELQSILHEYPDNEQIIKELLQNSEDAGARFVKMGYSPSSISDHLPDSYKKYMSGPAFCFYNDSIFEKEDWDGITMVRKSNKYNNPLKIGTFGIGFKSVFHITDTVMIISGETILFLDPLYEETDPNGECSFVQISDFLDQSGCGSKGLEHLHRFFGIDKEKIKNGSLEGTLFWFPLRNTPSKLSESVYTPQKVSDILESFKKDIGCEMLFLTSVEEIGVYKMVNGCWEVESFVSLDDSCALNVRNERERYKSKINSIEEVMKNDDQWNTMCEPVWMKYVVIFNVMINEVSSSQEWLIISYFHAGSMDHELVNLIRNKQSKYRPYFGIAARLDKPIPNDHGQIFCFLPLPFEGKSPSGLPVHINGFFALDSTRQHIKWPSHDQELSKSHLENDMLWNVLVVQEVLPVVYQELFITWKSIPKLAQQFLNIFLHCIPRMTEVKSHWLCVGNKIHQYMLDSEIPCLESKKWVHVSEGYFAVFSEETSEETKNTIKDLFTTCGKKVIDLREHEDLFEHWFDLKDLKQTSPQKTRNLLKEDKKYTSLDECSKALLLKYCCSDGDISDLNGIELLPLQNYRSFQLKEKSFKETAMVYLCGHEELEILIGKENCLVLNDTTEFGNLLDDIAKSGYYTFEILSPETCIQFLNEIIREESLTRKPMLLHDEETIFGENWLTKVWSYLKKHCKISLDQVKDSFLVKTQESDELKKISETFFFDEGLTIHHIKSLAYFRIWVVDMAFHDHPLLNAGMGIVHRNTIEEKSIVLGKCIEDGLHAYNDLNLCCNLERESFKDFLPNSGICTLVLPLQKLKMFKCYSSVSPSTDLGYTSLEDCKKVYTGNKDFPISFPTRMIIASSEHEHKLLSELLATKVDLTDCVQSSLEGIFNCSFELSDDETRRFCFYVLEKKAELKNWEKIQAGLNKVKFITNGAKQLCCADELYDPNDKILREFFLEQFKFPDEKYQNAILLKHLTFQTMQSPSLMKDIISTCEKMDVLTSGTSVKERMSTALLEIFRQNFELFKKVYESVCGFNIIPFKLERNRNYPKSMQWYNQSEALVSLDMLHGVQYEFVIGSVLPTSTKQWEEFIDKKPQILAVTEHFKNVVSCYQEDEHDLYSLMIKEIYQYLSEESDFEALLPIKCVLTENGFVRPTEIYIECDETDLDLKPYFYPLPKEYKRFQNVFENICCRKNQSSFLLVEALDKIQQKYTENNTGEEIEDLRKIENILTKLSELPSEEFSKVHKRIKVPINTGDSTKLVFKWPQECVYSDSDWFSRTFTEEDEVFLVNSRINELIAKKLGVRSLKKFTLSDAEDICAEFGQSEPLTQRLNRLLDESYTDGLSVPKELIQNADDAGATQVFFLYDERENEDARSCLLDAGMKECQGPALWAYNNAVFTSRDFQNIQKLSGATKKEDATKIGKFGLGFNAVYNLTDVPSFVSGTSLVYLDPHGKYLRDAILHERSPGIKLNLKNRIMLRKLKNQFKPFENVFRFRSSMFEENEIYEGTLFRFPLRTKQQASTSEISNKEYSKKEMEKLLTQLCKAAGNLILFTQNVKQIKIFHVSRHSKHPDKEMKAVLTVLKEEENRQNSILLAASKHCCDLEQESRFAITCKSKITLSSIGHDWVERKQPLNEETVWLISWALGDRNARKLFQTKKCDGALPLCCVGIPTEMLNGRLSPIYLGTKEQVFGKFGFYDRSHVFCFLPLPIETPLSFHVNGTFALSSDRKRLLNSTEDDKENTRQSIWNDFLLSDPTVEAVLELIIEINSAATETDSCYGLWPTLCDDRLWRLFGNEFYKAITNRPLPVFKTHQGYKSFKECLFLHKGIRKNTLLNEYAFEVLKKFPLNEKIITDIPLEIYNNLEKCDNFHDHVITYDQFITKSFLPNIATFCGVEVDKIVLEALRSRNDYILTAIKQSDCITSCKKNLRQCPQNLVHPYSSISGIFLTDIERFPTTIFCEEKDLEILVSLGMMKDEIPLDLLLSQSKHVKQMATTCIECALHRSNQLLRYIEYNVPNETKKEFLEIPFLPVKKKPTKWPPIKWHMETSRESIKCFDHKETVNNVEYFEKPCELYFQTFVNLVGCSKPVLESYNQKCLNENLKSLGVKSENDIDVSTLEFQIKQIIKIPENAQRIEIEEMCRDIYATIAKRLVLESDIQDFVCNQLSEMPCVLTDKTFAFPKQVIFNLSIDCSPYLFSLKPFYVQNFKPFFEKVGVREQFDTEDIISVLSQLRNQFKEKPLSKNDLDFVSRLTILFEEKMSVPKEDLFLPDENGFLCPVNELCMNDYDWISTTDSMRFLNAGISSKVAKLAGIKSKREHSLLKESDEFGDEFGQHEELTSRIKRILEGYPEACIFKELLQNAEDAGATVLHFIKDYRHHGTKHVFSDNWKDLQGPALCVYNDSVFSEKDLLGIQRLGTGSKRDDPMSTGQYGIGFNVVYHLTDVPTFLTRDFTKDLDILCVLDPHLKYIPQGSSKKPGRKFTNASSTLNKIYTDIMPCYLEESEIWESSRGTLFRFPLRCDTESFLSQKTANSVKLDELLHAFKRDVHEYLVFLQNVREIIISKINTDDSIEREFSIRTEKKHSLNAKEHLHTLMCNARDQMKNDGSYVCQVKRTEMIHQLQININNERIEDWVVATGFGFFNTELIPKEIQKAYAIKQLYLLPFSGVAFNLNRGSVVQCQNNQNKENTAEEKLYKSKAYCGLPLPLEIGLPVHINGQFILDYEARRSVWWSETNCDFKVHWNKSLIENVIVPTYISLLKHLRTVLFQNILTAETQISAVNKFHCAFPNGEKITENVWKHTAKTLYIQIVETGCCVFPMVQRDFQILKNAAEKKEKDSRTTKFSKSQISEKKLLKINWVSALPCENPAYFEDNLGHNQEEYEFLLGILQNLGMITIKSPMWIFNSMKSVHIKVHKVSSEEVLEFLKSYNSNVEYGCKIVQVNVPVSETKFDNVDFVNRILKWCLNVKEKLDFSNVPLLLSEAEHLLVFHEKNKIYITKLLNLLPKSANKIAHRSQIWDLRSEPLQKFAKNLEIQDFSEHLTENVPENFCRGTIELWNKNSSGIPNCSWIKSVWMFFSENLSHYKREQNTNLPERDKNPMTQLCSALIQYLRECSLLPVSVNDTCKLYPLKYGKRVLKLIPNVYPNEQEALKKLGVPIFDDKCLFPEKSFYGSENEKLKDLISSSCLMTSVNNVIDTLNCLFHNISDLELESKACETMLDFFVTHKNRLNRTCFMNLKRLPIYSGLEGNVLCLEGDVIVFPEGVPVEGMTSFGNQRNINFIRPNKVSLDFFKTLGCIITTSADIYIEYILPNFECLPCTAILHHFEFLRDIVIPQLKFKEERKMQLLIYLLQNTALIPVHGTRLAVASKFFNPHVVLFKRENQLCSPSELPPSPFDEEEWEDFLLLCGMKNDMTPDIFVDFAIRLEKLGKKYGCKPFVKNISNLMVNLLFSDPGLSKCTKWMQKLQDVMFLNRHEMDEDYQVIAPQFGKGNSLVCFHESTIPSNELLVWTQMNIVSEDLVNKMRNAKFNTKVLSIVEQPPLPVVLDHVRIVTRVHCSAEEPHCTKTKQIIINIMTEIYAFLQENWIEKFVRSISNVPFIFIEEKMLFVLPEQVVLEKGEHEDIPPYLYMGPVSFGKFYPLFEKAGAARLLSCGHLAEVLQKILKKSEGRNLEQNEMEAVKTAVKILFSKLGTEDGDDLNAFDLFLPAENKTLILSSTLIFIDDKRLAERIKRYFPTMNYFLGFKELGLDVDNPVFEMNKLPKKHLPQFLSKIVREEIEANCKKLTVPSDRAKKLQIFLHSVEFIRAVCRLVMDEKYKNGGRWKESIAAEIQKKLQSVKVKCVKEIITVMTIYNEKLLNTFKQKVMFPTEEFDENGSSILCIYVIESTTFYSSTENHLSQISIRLNDYLGKPLNESLIYLSNVLSCYNDPMEIQRKLDSLEICKIDGENILSSTYMSNLGTKIPLSFHHSLDNLCTYIEEGECVVYEKYDPIIDEDSACVTEPVYILAKILKANFSGESKPNGDEWTICYVIDIGDDDPIEVTGSTLYKFLRDNITDRNLDNFDDAEANSSHKEKEYIRNTLWNVFKRPEKEFKRTLKRLILHYYPHKPTNNKDNLNDLFSFLIFIKNRLQNEQSLNDDDLLTFDHGSEYPLSLFDKAVLERISVTSHDIEQENTLMPGSVYPLLEIDEPVIQHVIPNVITQPIFKPAATEYVGPKPEHARNWFRQAEYDLEASTLDKHSETGNNWACFKCHQSAEKALKALLYQIDAAKVIQTHKLTELTDIIKNSELTELAEHLESITGNYFKMRYPDALFQYSEMTIPAEIYCSTQAEGAYDYARKILDHVRSKIPNL